ncbi:MAG: hypothetical protein RBT49_06895 [Bacteroidales bacterium]|jgi:hypothetical protein|nr:hypothetical protein [Bacteroidales bacterium]
MKTITFTIIFFFILIYAQKDSSINTAIGNETIKLDTISTYSSSSSHSASNLDTLNQKGKESDNSYIDLIIKYFTLLGSVLGIFAFLQNVLSPRFISNKEKWKELTNHINEIDLTNICLGIESGNYIDNENLYRIDTLIDFIDNNHEIIQFKSLFKNKYKKQFLELKKTYIRLRDIVQVPLWDINGSRWMPNKKEYFITGHSRENDMKYRNDLAKVYDIAKEMEIIFKNIGKLANKDLIDILLFK